MGAALGLLSALYSWRLAYNPGQPAAAGVKISIVFVVYANDT
jgi:hypothetical protein